MTNRGVPFRTEFAVIPSSIRWKLVPTFISFIFLHQFNSNEFPLISTRITQRESSRHVSVLVCEWCLWRRDVLRVYGAQWWRDIECVDGIIRKFWRFTSSKYPSTSNSSFFSEIALELQCNSLYSSFEVFSSTLHWSADFVHINWIIFALVVLQFLHLQKQLQKVHFKVNVSFKCSKRWKFNSKDRG